MELDSHSHNAKAKAVARRRYGRLCPMGRMLRDDEFAASIAFLLSDGASMMTGHNMVVDGGWTTW